MLRKRISCYVCGPTVYDHTHIGHARTYVQLDIIRRLAPAPVTVALGITDVDDKIIKKAQSLLHTQSSSHILNGARDIHSAVKHVAKHYEREFIADMKALGVAAPHTLLRVSEHIPEIIAFILKIMQNGFAYTDQHGNVWFDTASFDKHPDHSYGKLRKIAPIQGEDVHDDLTAKKNQADFALWKSSKEGEPFWESPWGKGRPGWHIECSTMSMSFFRDADTLDVHCGGIDLAFPHHTNEIAQCEAYFQSNLWVKKWIHTGHLHISGLKMSKSLKNFITVKTLLERHSAEQFRMFCLLHHYSSTINFTYELLESAQDIINRFDSFLENIRNEIENLDYSLKWTDREHELHKEVLNTEIQIEEFISTNYNTKGAVSSLLQLVAKTNIYLHDLEQKRSLELLQEIEGLIRNWLLKFGFGHHIQVPNVFSKSSFYSQNESLKVWNDFANFRSLIRKEALDLLKSDPILAKKLLIACDAVRENAASKGVQLEDAGKSHRVKLINTGKN